MTALDEVRANTCPYCGEAYTIAARGCVAQCADWQLHARLIIEALREQEESWAQIDS